MKLFDTKRLIAREFRIEDAQEAFSFYGNKEIFNYIGDRKVWMDSISDLRVLDRHIQYYRENPGMGLWAIEEKESNHLIGHIGIKSIDIEEKLQFEVGYLIDKAYQGKGYASEITKAALDYAKNILKLEEVIAIAREHNYASIAVMKNCSMVFQKMITYKEISNVVLYSKRFN